MRRILNTILAAVTLLALQSCETFKNVPVSLAYTTHVAGHDVTAAWSKKDGLAFAAEHLRILTQK